MRPLEEVQEQLNKAAKARMTINEKESLLKEEMTNILMGKYITGLLTMQRNHGEISRRDFEVMFSGFAKEVRELYTGSKPF